MEQQLTKAQKRANKWTPWYFVAFFVFIAIVNGIFVTVATSTHRGVVTEHAYQKGLDYNQSIASAEAQAKLGWTSTITLKKNTLSFNLKNKEGEALNEADVTAFFARTTQAGDDFSIPLTHTNNGNYSSTVNFPAKGQWNVTVAVQWNNTDYQQSSRLNVQ